MEENKYRVMERNNILADNMTLDIALLFIQAYYTKYYLENIELKIQKYPKEGEDND